MGNANVNAVQVAGGVQPGLDIGRFAPQQMQQQVQGGPGGPPVGGHYRQPNLPPMHGQGGPQLGGGGGGGGQGPQQNTNFQRPFNQNLGPNQKRRRF